MFELVVQIRDQQGNPTGKTKIYSTESPEEIGSTWERYEVSKRNPSKNKNKKQKSLREQIKASLERLTKLEKGWDGRGGIPFNYQTYLSALEVVSALVDVIKIKPKVVPSTDGRAQLEFAKGDKELELEFVDKDTIRYLLWDPKNNITEEFETGAKDIRRLRQALIYLHK